MNNMNINMNNMNMNNMNMMGMNNMNNNNFGFNNMPQNNMMNQGMLNLNRGSNSSPNLPANRGNMFNNQIQNPGQGVGQRGMFISMHGMGGGPGTMISKTYMSKMDYSGGQPREESYQSQSIKQIGKMVIIFLKDKKRIKIVIPECKKLHIKDYLMTEVLN